jgi:hypothetical protein
MSLLINFTTEIELIRKCDQYGIQVLKGREKLSMNNYQKGLYLDLSSFANALDVNLNKLLEDLSYNPAIRGHVAYYHHENRVINVNSHFIPSQLPLNISNSSGIVSILL